MASTSLLRQVFAILALLLIAGTAASDVLVLTKDNFDSTLATEDTILVEFYAPWCTHCKQLAPKYEKVATALKDIVKVAKVDCTAEQGVCEAQGVRGYPTLKVFKKDQEAISYSGAREASDLISFMKKSVRPLVNPLNADNVDAFLKDESVVILGFYDAADSTSAAVFNQVARKFAEKVTFASISDASIASKYGLNSSPSATIYKDGANAAVFNGVEFDEKNVEDFVSEYAVPVMEELGPSNYADYIKSGLPLAIVILGDETDRSKYGAALESYAKTKRNVVNFVYLDGQKYAGFADTLNLRQEFPAFGIQSTSGPSAKFPLNQDTPFSVERVIELTEDVLSGSAKPSLKSEPIPASQPGPVIVVVGKSYEDIVLEKGKDVLIEFYAPWCGHCKNLAPTYDKVAEHYQSNPNIVIAKMDITANDLPLGTPFEVEGFPTIKLVTADNAIVDYEGNRDFDSFIEFISEHATNSGASATTTDDKAHEEL